MFALLRTLVTPPVVFLAVYDNIGIPAKVNGKSMRPNFNPLLSQTEKRRRGYKMWMSDYVWVKTWNNRSFRACLQPGDVIAFWSPMEDNELLIKRVLAVPGDRIITRSYRQEQLVLPPNYLWVEGDNSSNSEDSNTFGPVSAGLVQGKVTHILWPPHRRQRVSTELTPNQISRIV